MLLSILRLIIDVVTAVFGGALLLRFWMQVVRIRPPTSIAHFLFQVTDWFVRPARRILPGFGGYDWVCLIGAVLPAILSALFDCWLNKIFSIRILALLSTLTFITWIIYGFMGLLILQVIFSWVNPHAPLAPFVNALTYPLLSPVRRLIPQIGGLDLSTLIVFILLQIGLRVITSFIFSNLI